MAVNDLRPRRPVARHDPTLCEATSLTGFSYVSERTFYTGFGDWFAVLCATIALMALIAERVVG